MTPAARVVRLCGRLASVAVVLGIVVLVGVQFAGIVAKNIAVAGELSAMHAQIADLHSRDAERRRTIERLSDPAGAVPEIHDELHVVGPNEEIIFVRGLSQPSPAAHRWVESP